MPVCTKEASYRPRPEGLSAKQYKQVISAEDISAYIVKNLNTIGAPVSLMYGTMLHEYRNGTGPCVQANFNDKDFDIAVFAQHFPLVLAMADDIEKKFGWKLKPGNVFKERLFMVFLPSNQHKAGKGHQIDVYGFEIHRPSNGLIYFPWDEVTVAMDAFLPLEKHKMPAYDDGTSREVFLSSGEERPHFYMPFNPSCLLANMYGADFMTPKKGHFIRKVAYDDPNCVQMKLTSAQQQELERQLLFGEVAARKQDIAELKLVEEDLSAKGHFGIVSCIR